MSTSPTGRASPPTSGPVKRPVPAVEASRRRPPTASPGRHPLAPPSPATVAWVSALLGAIFLIPTGVVVWDIYHDRKEVELYDFRPEALDGLWRVRCGRLRGMVLEFRNIEPLKVTAIVRHPGRGHRVGYRSGHEILEARMLDDGAWKGRVLWRPTRVAARWRGLGLRKRGRRTEGISPALRCFENLFQYH